MGGKNVFYFLTPLERGWLQVLPVAYDVRRQEWFDTTASAMRHFGDRRDEALYWKERPLTFNTSCFGCHVSQLSKNYDLKSDSYHTTWAEPGINCETCHGPSAGHVQLFRELPTNQPAPGRHQAHRHQQADHRAAQRHLRALPRQDVARDHELRARRPLLRSLRPGRLRECRLLPRWPRPGRELHLHPVAAQPVRQVRPAGLHPLPHLERPLPVQGSGDTPTTPACPVTRRRSQDAPAHTHHKAGTAGNECISCHMPMTEFARMRRSDHSMRPPTPATTLLYNSPNACNLCHTNKDAAWADKLVREWRKRDYQKPVLERAALIAAARKQDWKKLPDILAYLSSPDREEIQTASLVRLLADCPSDDKWPVLRKLMTDPSPLVRASVAEALGERLDQPNIAALVQGHRRRLPPRARARRHRPGRRPGRQPAREPAPPGAQRNGRTDGLHELAPGRHGRRTTTSATSTCRAARCRKP